MTLAFSVTCPAVGGAVGDAVPGYSGAARAAKTAVSMAICDTIWPMARKEVLVQLDDELVGRLDELAAAEGTNRSELLRRGAMAVLEAADLAKADQELQAAYRAVPQEPGLVKAARRLAARTVPEW